MKDKNTIGLTIENDILTRDLIERGLFSQDLDVARFALAVGLVQGDKTGTHSVTTKWNVGSLDRDGQLRSMIELLRPGTDEPYRFIEQVINDGLVQIGNLVRENPSATVRELLALGRGG